MGASDLAAPAPETELIETQLAKLRIDGERHSVVWLRNRERTVSVLVDRPEEGGEKMRLLGRFFPDESREAIDTLIDDYRAHYVKAAVAERIRPRALEPGDVMAPGPPGEAPADV